MLDDLFSTGRIKLRRGEISDQRPGGG